MRSSWLIDGGDLTGTRGHLSEAAPGLCPGTTAAPRFAGRVKDTLCFMWLLWLF